jgi:hypothetical protein
MTGLSTLWRELGDHETTLPIPRMSYAEAMTRYGSDKDTPLRVFQHWEEWDVPGLICATSDQSGGHSAHRGCNAVVAEADVDDKDSGRPLSTG